MGVPFNFVSAADGTNVVKIFRDALTLAAEYKKNPPKDDFMADVMDLLGDDIFDGTPSMEKDTEI